MEKKLAGIASLTESANPKHFTMDADDVIAFVKKVIALIINDLTNQGKNPVMSREQALQEAMRFYLDADGELNDDFDFYSDQEAMVFIFETLRTWLTVRDYKAEAARIIEGIRNDEVFAKSFFYGSSTIPGLSIAQLRSRLIHQVAANYGVKVSLAEFSTVLYEKLYDFGTWRPLMTFNYKSSFFSWLTTIASHAILEHLELDGRITISRARTPGNTRLVLKMYAPAYCRVVIEDMVKIGPLRDMLLAVYVERLDQAAIQERFDMDETLYRKTLRTSEKLLKSALLNTLNDYDDVLADKSSRKLKVSLDVLSVVGHKSSSDSPLRDVLGIAPDDAEFESKVEAFISDFITKLGWKTEDIFIFTRRYVEDVKPVAVAESLGNRTRAFIDMRFSKLRAAFNAAIREWWNEVNKINN